uniref:Uncharacterized protein n=1 Tax=Solanum lycopersicum TaxID=4081 RepID=K4B5X9_SOLLC
MLPIEEQVEMELLYPQFHVWLPCYWTLYQWYNFGEKEHFTNSTGLREYIEQWTFVLYATRIQYLMSIFYVHEVRNQMIADVAP